LNAIKRLRQMPRLCCPATTYGHVYYVRSIDDGQTWSRPLNVNGRIGSAIALGTVRGRYGRIAPGGCIMIERNRAETVSARMLKSRVLTVALRQRRECCELLFAKAFTMLLKRAGKSGG
jgi:hypothetical protein